MRILLVSVRLYHKSSIQSTHQLGTVPFQLLSPVFWIVPIIYPLEPLRLIPYQKNREPQQGTSMRLGIMYLLISLFVRLLAGYLLVMTESTHTVNSKEVLSTTMQLRFWFGMMKKSHLEATILWWVCHGLDNGFGNNLLQKSPITMIKRHLYSRWII